MFRRRPQAVLTRAPGQRCFAPTPPGTGGAARGPRTHDPLPACPPVARPASRRGRLRWPLRPRGPDPFRCHTGPSRRPARCPRSWWRRSSTRSPGRWVRVNRASAPRPATGARAISVASRCTTTPPPWVRSSTPPTSTKTPSSPRRSKRDARRRDPAHVGAGLPARSEHRGREHHGRRTRRWKRIAARRLRLRATTFPLGWSPLRS